MTYSIVARCPETGHLGVAVQSHYFGVGSVVPWGRAGVGVVATQSIVETSYGPFGLDLLGRGESAETALAQLVAADHGAELRQVALLAAGGSFAHFTGSSCIPAAGHISGHHVSAQANLVESSACWGAMVDAYAASTGDLAHRLLAALRAAEATGGDIRGKQSAAMLIVVGESSAPDSEPAVVDVRVDDHPEPLDEVERLLVRGSAMSGLVAALETPGLLSGEFDVGDDAFDVVAADLTRAQMVLGSDNVEPSVWLGLLHARAGHDDRAVDAWSFAAATEPRTGELLRRLAAAGMWTRPTSDFDALLRRVAEACR